MIPLRPPPTLDRGPGFLKKAYNLLRKFCIEGQIYSVVVSKNTSTPELLRTAHGQLLKLPPGGGDTAQPFPFELIGASDDTGPKVRVRYGVVADGNTGDEWIPNDMALGDDPPFIIPISGDSGTIYMHIETDSATLEITGITIETGAGTPSSTVNDAYKQLGSFAIDGSNVSLAQAAQTSLGYANANGTHIYWTT